MKTKLNFLFFLLFGYGSFSHGNNFQSRHFLFLWGDTFSRKLNINQGLIYCAYYLVGKNWKSVNLASLEPRFQFSLFFWRILTYGSGGILGSASRAEFPVSLSNHVGFTPRLLYSSTHHSPRKFYPSENWLSSRCLTSVIVQELVFPSRHQPLTSDFDLYLRFLWAMIWGRFLILGPDIKITSIAVPV